MRRSRGCAPRMRRFGNGTMRLCLPLLWILSGCQTTPPPIVTGCPVDHGLLRELTPPPRPVPVPTPEGPRYTNGQLLDAWLEMMERVALDNARKGELRAQLVACERAME